MVTKSLLFNVLSLLIVCQSFGQTDVKEIKTPALDLSALKVFIDCQQCDQTFLTQQINNIQFVRDRQMADVHLLFTSQSSGAGGKLERIQFIGLGAFKHLSDILTYATLPTNSTEEERQQALKYVELGLVRYRLEAGQVDLLELVVYADEKVSVEEVTDPWNSWVYSLNAGGWATGEETKNTFNINGNINARRITAQNKFIVRAGFNQTKEVYNYNNVKTASKKRDFWGSAQDVLTINDHFSYGFFADAGNSIYSNYKLYSVLKTGLEYDFFEYAEAFNKQAIVAYNLGARYNDYYDTTVFNQSAEVLSFQEVTLGGTVKQDWGNMSSTLTYHNYLHDFKLNSLSLWLNFKVRLFKGFSWRLNGKINFNQNQVNIAKQGVSIEDVLLQQQQLGSAYSYWMSTGINYSFGSMYNSVVNPRFDI
ncbi:hypothetical protein [Crocinitomix catalasitica]|uniref:hypothetical protein n=1 Tax=Crocinitomix catalasitica TaxID=184607 RepID=UPI0004835742|nr:hypothetical protein [Crocinitomix catalasitica]